MIKTERDAAILDLAIKGIPYKEIASQTQVSVKTIGNLLAKGGRLSPALQSLRQSKEAVLVEHSLSAWDSLLSAKDPAIAELKRIALESPNDVARLKAVDMIIELTGIKNTDKPPILDPHRQTESLNKFLDWINEKLLVSFGENAPKITVSYSPLSSTLENKMTPQDVERMEAIAKELVYLEDIRRADPLQRGEITNVKPQ